MYLVRVRGEPVRLLGGKYDRTEVPVDFNFKGFFDVRGFFGGDATVVGINKTVCRGYDNESADD